MDKQGQPQNITICLLILVLIAQAVSLSERGQTDKQTDTTESSTPRRQLYSRQGNKQKKSNKKYIMYHNNCYYV